MSPSNNENQAVVQVGQPIAVSNVVDIDPADTRRRLAGITAFQSIVRRELHEGHDYGTIPGAGNKPALLKPGAEKIIKLLNCFDDSEIVSKVEDWDKPFFRYLIKCTLYEISSGAKISSGLGECNSYEQQYRYRWVDEALVPANLDKSALKSRGGKKTCFEYDFSLEKRQTTGQYGKAESYWAAFDTAIKNKTAKRTDKPTKAGKVYPGWEIQFENKQYQVPNPDIYDLVNTILKKAVKRAKVDAALSAGRLSDLFTQDIEDFAEYEPTTIVPVHALPAPTDEPMAAQDPVDDFIPPDEPPFALSPNGGGNGDDFSDLGATSTEPPKPWDHLADFAKAKKQLGDELYYEILSTFKVEHANKIPVGDRPAALKALRAAYRKAHSK